MYEIMLLLVNINNFVSDFQFSAFFTIFSLKHDASQRIRNIQIMSRSARQLWWAVVAVVVVVLKI